MTPHLSDSSEQGLAERELLQALQQELDATFSLGAVLPIDVGVKPDGIDPEKKIVVEIFARIGKLKAAQNRKVKADLFKLAFIRKELGSDWRVIVCFADPQAAAIVRGQSWARRAAEAFGIEIFVLSLSDEMKIRVLAAQTRQHMGNTGTGA